MKPENSVNIKKQISVIHVKRKNEEFTVNYLCLQAVVENFRDAAVFVRKIGR